MFIRKEQTLLKEIVKLADEVEELGFLIASDGEADIEDIELFRTRYKDITDRLFKWRGKVDKYVANTLNPMPEKKKGGKNARVQPKENIPKASNIIRIQKNH